MDSRHEGADALSVRKAVLDLALRHHLVSKYTSLVAVDVTPTRRQATELRFGAVPTNLAQGWRYEKVFGRLPQTATPASLQVVIGLFALLCAFLGYCRGFFCGRRRGT